MSILFKEMVFEALCVIWDVSHPLHLNLRMHHTNIRGHFSDLSFWKKNTFSNEGLFQSQFLSVTCKKTAFGQLTTQSCKE